MIGILGGGLSGIVLQRELKAKSEILEKSDHPGGLCRTFWKNGFGFDIGGHILYTGDETVSLLIDDVLGENVHSLHRKNEIFYHGRYVKYPFENDLAALDKKSRYECLMGFIEAEGSDPSNLEEWAYCNFGKGIAEHYLLPYNRKIWNIDPKEMGLEWVERIPKPPLSDVVKSALGIATEGNKQQLHFRYPQSGGIEAFVKALFDPESKIETGFAVDSIRRNDSAWIVRSGSVSREYENIVICFPVHEALKCLDEVPKRVLTAAANLRYNSLRLAMLAVDNSSLLKKSALYIPDSSVLPHRLCFMGYFSKDMIQPGTSSLVAEVTSISGDKVFEMSDSQFLERVVDDLDRIGIIEKSSIIESESMRIQYAYPICDIDYIENRKIVHDFFKEIGIPLLGRFAEFDYINMDESILHAIRLADKLNENAS